MTRACLFFYLDTSPSTSRLHMSKTSRLHMSKHGFQADVALRPRPPGLGSSLPASGPRPLRVMQAWGVHACPLSPGWSSSEAHIPPAWPQLPGESRATARSGGQHHARWPPSSAPAPQSLSRTPSSPPRKILPLPSSKPRTRTEPMKRANLALRSTHFWFHCCNTPVFFHYTQKTFYSEIFCFGLSGAQ